MAQHSSPIHLYVGYPSREPNYPSIPRALASLPPVSPLPQQFPAPSEESITPVIIHVAPGVYEERLLIDRPRVTLVGEGAASTVLTCRLGAYEQMPDGARRGTFRTACVRIDTHDFTARHITFQNTAGCGRAAGQALALYADGDRLVFEDCRLISGQDTLFTAPLPPTPALPGGFTGPGEHKPRIMGRHLYRRCYLEGDVDFIFGSAVAWFEDCTLFSRMPDSPKAAKDSGGGDICGYVTAASTPKDAPFGYVFSRCKLKSDCPPHTVYLGRPWREWAKTVFLNCELGAHIHPAGWADWDKPHTHFYYGEYRSRGPGAEYARRAAFSHLLTDEEAGSYTMENVLGGPDDWNP